MAKSIVRQSCQKYLYDCRSFLGLGSASAFDLELLSESFTLSLETKYTITYVGQQYFFPIWLGNKAR